MDVVVREDYTRRFVPGRIYHVTNRSRTCNYESATPLFIRQVTT
jgi:hypothetical protein